MEGGVINRALRTNPVTKKFFLGTFPADRIPAITSYPSSMVVNMDNSNLPGSHWVAIFVPSRHTVFYYDSFGVKPSNRHIREFLRKFLHVHINPTTFQSLVSDVCGFYVMYFLYFCSMGYSVSQIHDNLVASSNPDIEVVRFVRRYIVM